MIKLINGRKVVGRRKGRRLRETDVVEEDSRSWWRRNMTINSERSPGFYIVATVKLLNLH